MLFDKSFVFEHATNEQILQFLQTRRIEDTVLEYKEDFTRDDGNNVNRERIIRNIVAFANTKGGYIFYGISDDFNNRDIDIEECVIGLTDNSPSIEDIGGWERDSIVPTLYSTVKLFQIYEKPILIIKVPEGVNKPYSIYNQGERCQYFFARRSGRTERLTPQETSDLIQDIIQDKSSGKPDSFTLDQPKAEEVELVIPM